VLDGDPAPLPQKEAEPANFRPMPMWPNGWMDEDSTWYGNRPQPRSHCVRWGPSSPRKRGTAAPPLFSPCLSWPRSPVSATAALLSLCSTCTNHLPSLTFLITIFSSSIPYSSLSYAFFSVFTSRSTFDSHVSVPYAKQVLTQDVYILPSVLMRILNWSK